MQALWLAVKDLLEPTQQAEARHLVLYFLRALVGGQYDDLNLLRAHFFNIIAQHKVEEDFPLWCVCVCRKPGGRDRKERLATDPNRAYV